ncbi:S-adenosyl-L-methionine-dependent methyltransferase [Xylariaceae sp. FL0594]|nr:S-adenosyl-L-methionine-dependent methyltransferase [Xylariaceae sp. FL0594]
MATTENDDNVTAARDREDMDQMGGRLEIDDHWDGDSALGGMSRLSSTESVGSSIYDHVIENGRTYHRFKEGKYMLPNDEKEQTRLDYQHQLYTAVLNGRLYISPIGNTPKNVLDVGTGTGIWAIEFGLEHPSAHVIGIDLSPIQPSYSPPNVTFEICDAEDEWLFREPFDFIHMRAMVTCFSNPLFVFKEAYRSLAPGGYIELREPIFPFAFMTPPPTPNSEPCALQQWCDMIMQASRLSGRDWGIASRYAQILAQPDVGFVNVVQREEAMALSPWVKGKQNKHLSLLLQHDILNLLEPMSMALFTRVLGWDRQRVLDFLELVKKDVQDTSIHAYSKGVHIYAQKPFDAPTES